MKLKTIIVDDEKPSREALARYLSDYCQDVEVLATCNSVKTAYNAILKFEPHLIFLDIEMPNKNGFDLLRMFNPINFKVVFITAYAEYAINAFRFSATDYLLKPVMIDELVEAVNKVRSELQNASGNLNLQKLIETMSRKNYEFRQLVISDSNGFKVVETTDIIMCEADGYCTHFFLTGNEKLTSSKNLKHYEELLSGQGFIRVHNSFMINMVHIKSYSNQGEIMLSRNLSCPLGNVYKQKFLERFKKYR
ncbi:MAG TPA: LytTR family DNA-binding domain-containing protein [Bacteroidales bacterium]|jgi:two-component system LytT family response regulator|nr:LytTR family DNA-binding domain-containing protein [Bacteroidales bacterium]